MATMTRRRLAVGLAICSAVAVTVAATSSDAAPSHRGMPTYTIGFEGPLSGANSRIGQWEVKGAKLAVAQANAAGNLDFRVKLRPEDDEGDPARSPAAAVALVNNPLVRGVVGPSFSGSTVAVGRIYDKAHLGFVSPSASNQTLSKQGWSTFHRVVPSDSEEGRQAADWIARRGEHSLYVLQDESPYGKAVGDAVAHEARHDGVHVTEKGVDAVRVMNYGPAARRIAASGAHAVFYAGYDFQAALLAKALKKAGYTGLRVSGNGVFDSVFTREAKSAGDGWYVVCGCLTSYASKTTHAFAMAYHQMFGAAPGLFSAQAYDSTNAMIRAIKKAVAKGTPTRRVVNAQLAQLDFHGVSTQVVFAADGDIAGIVARVNLFQDRSQKFVELGSIRARG